MKTDPQKTNRPSRRLLTIREIAELDGCSEKSFPPRSESAT